MYLLINRHAAYYQAYALQLKRAVGAQELTWGLMSCSQRLGPQELDPLIGVRLALEPICEADSPEALIEVTQRCGLESEPFVIEYSRIQKRAGRWPSRRLMGQLALQIKGEISYDQPQVRFHLIESAERYYLTRLVHSPTWPKPSYAHRPHAYSAALSSELAALAINAVSQIGDRIIDPTCGSGTIIYEALQRGRSAKGYDHKWSWVIGARDNLEAFGFSSAQDKKRFIAHADARHLDDSADAIVANLPYGRVVSIDMSRLESILRQLKHCAQNFAFFSGQDLSKVLDQLEYTNIQSLDLSIQTSHQRFLCFAQG